MAILQVGLKSSVWPRQNDGISHFSELGSSWPGELKTCPKIVLHVRGRAENCVLGYSWSYKSTGSTIPVGEDSLSGESSDRRVTTDNKIRTQEQVVQIIDRALVTLISWYITNSFIEERSLRSRSI